MWRTLTTCSPAKLPTKNSLWFQQWKTFQNYTLPDCLRSSNQSNGKGIAPQDQQSAYYLLIIITSRGTTSSSAVLRSFLWRNHYRFWLAAKIANLNINRPSGSCCVPHKHPATHTPQLLLSLLGLNIAKLNIYRKTSSMGTNNTERLIQAVVNAKQSKPQRGKMET